MSAKRKTASTAPSTNKLDSISNAAFHGSSSIATAIALVKAAGYAQEAHQPAIRDAFIVGHMAGALFKGENLTDEMAAKVKAILAKHGATSKSASRRTVTQETAYSAARMAFSRVLKAAGFGTVAKQGGARNTNTPKGAQDKPATEDKPTADDKPAPTTRALKRSDVCEWLADWIAQAQAFMKANAKIASLDQRGLVADIAKTIASMDANGDRPAVHAKPASKGELTSLPPPATLPEPTTSAVGAA